MGFRFFIAWFWLCTIATSAWACGQGTSLIDKDFPDDPAYFGKSTEFDYVSGKELYVFPAENLWYSAFYGRNDSSLDFCATVRAVEANADSYAGLMFWRKDNANFTVLVARPDGVVAVAKMVAGQWQDATARYDIPNFKTGTVLSTRLEVQLEGSQATFFADDVKLGTASDQSMQGEGNNYGYIAGSGAKRSIFAFSQPSITSAKAGTPADGQSSIAATKSGNDPDLDDVHLAIYKGLLKEGLGANLPDGLVQDSIYGNAQSPFGMPEIILDLKGSGMLSEFAYRFFKTKDLASAYIGDDTKQPYIEELTKPGVLLNFGWRHAKADFDFPFVSAADPDNGQQWARAVAQVDTMILMVTVAKKHPHIRMDAKVDEALVTKAGDMLSNAIAGAKDAGLHYAFSSIRADSDPVQNQPKP
jgi:hypothetical protein